MFILFKSGSVLLLEEHLLVHVKYQCAFLQQWHLEFLKSFLFPTFVERQDERSSTALSVCLEEVSEGRTWRRNESIQWAESFIIPKFITMSPKNKCKLLLFISCLSGIGNLRLLFYSITEFVPGTFISAILEYFSLYPASELCCVNKWGQFIRWGHVAVGDLLQLFLGNPVILEWRTAGWFW